MFLVAAVPQATGGAITIYTCCLVAEPFLICISRGRSRSTSYWRSHYNLHLLLDDGAVIDLYFSRLEPFHKLLAEPLQSTPAA